MATAPERGRRTPTPDARARPPGGPRPAVIVMAKAPAAGRVKTRLAPLLGPAGAARLQAELIRHTTRTAARAGSVWVAVDPPSAVAEVGALAPEGARLVAQRGTDLGKRMSAAVDHVWAHTQGPVIVVGTDVPTLAPSAIAGAARLLATGADVVIGPALDGGYYLIGLARPEPGVFTIDPVLWGGDGVLDATLEALRRDRLSVALLPALRDLDTPADAAVLAGDPGTPPAVAALLAAGRVA